MEDGSGTNSVSFYKEFESLVSNGEDFFHGFYLCYAAFLLRNKGPQTHSEQLPGFAGKSFDSIS